MSQQEIKELASLPLEVLIGGPLNAAVLAQANSALTTATFVQDNGFIKTRNGAKTELAVRTVKADYKISEVQPDAANTGKFKTVEVTRELSVPFLSLLNVPSLEVSEVEIDFNVRLESVRSTEVTVSSDTTTTTGGSANGGLDLGSFGIPVQFGASMHVQSTNQTKFEGAYGDTHTSEYNLHITVRARQSPPPKGVDRLFALAERMVDSAERANAEVRRLNG